MIYFAAPSATTVPTVGPAQSSFDPHAFLKTLPEDKLANLGLVAVETLNLGQNPSDALLVDLIALAIRHIPATQGWILDGFPTTGAQAAALETALLGMEPPVPPPKFITMEGVPGDILRQDLPVPTIEEPRGKQGSSDLLLVMWTWIHYSW